MTRSGQMMRLPRQSVGRLVNADDQRFGIVSGEQGCTGTDAAERIENERPLMRHDALCHRCKGKLVVSGNGAAEMTAQVALYDFSQPGV